MTAENATGTEYGLRIVMIPDYRATNPYQRLIAEGLEALGAQVNFYVPVRRRTFPLRIAANQFDVDVLHLHWITPFLRDSSLTVYAAFAARLLLDIVLTRAAGVSVVWTIHNKVSHEARYPRFEMAVRRCVARIVDAKIVHSPEIRREIAAEYGQLPSSFDIVPHASFGNLYGEPLGRSEARDELGLAADGRVFLNFGLMRPYKGLKRLLDSWSASGLGAAGHTLLLAGEFNDPDFRAEIVTQAAATVGVRIDAGHVPNDRVRLYFSACDAIVLPFERILTSGSLHLAITYCKPIVAPRIGSVVEMLRDAGGFLYEVADTDGLRDALVNCARADAAEIESYRQAMNAVRGSLLDWADVARATLAVYERVRHGRDRRGRGNPEPERVPAEPSRS